MFRLNRINSIIEIRQALSSGETSIDEMNRYYFEQIKKINPDLNACISILDPTEFVKENGKKLSGIPMVLKDLFETEGIPTTAGAEFLRKNIPRKDGTVVRKLKEAGASILGKSNMHEIALGVTNINQHYGNCLNPWDIERIPGGSSGGSAVAVASGMCVAALGSDTGGSIRIPASLCGIIGLKPTFGRVSLHGVIPLSWNLDHVGPMTNNVEDAAILLEVISGYDPMDPASVATSSSDYSSQIEDGIRGWKVAFAVGEYIEDSQPDVLTKVESSIRVFEKCGARVEKINVPWLREAAQANGIITPADAAAFHHDRILRAPHEFGEDILARLKIGMAYTSSEYAHARRIQMEIRRKYKLFFEEYDLLLLPTTPCTAPFIEGTDALEQAKKLTRFTAPFNLTGLPALSIPCGFSKEDLPIGLQMVAPEWEEARLLTAARSYERSTSWRIEMMQILSGKY